MYNIVFLKKNNSKVRFRKRLAALCSATHKNLSNEPTDFIIWIFQAHKSTFPEPYHHPMRLALQKETQLRVQ